MTVEKKRLELRVDPDLYDRMEAERQHRRPRLSVNLFVQELLEEALEARAKQR